MSRKLGIEIECILPYHSFDSGCDDDECESDHDSDEGRTVLHALRRAGAEVGSDGSIEAPSGSRGIEVRIGHVQGADMEATVRRVCKVLNDADATVNASCGLHVHADAPELKTAGSLLVYTASYSNIIDLIDNNNGNERPAMGSSGEGIIMERLPRSLETSTNNLGFITVDSRNFMVQNINREYRYLLSKTWAAMRFMGLADGLLRAAIPQSRRHNQYCEPFARHVKTGGERPATLNELYRGIKDRYCGINFVPLQSHGTIENRYHGGTTNPDKIIHWARMWERIVDMAVQNPSDELALIEEVISDKARREMLLSLLALPQETEAHIRRRIASLASSDSGKVARFIRNKKRYQEAASKPVLVSGVDMNLAERTATHS